MYALGALCFFLSFAWLVRAAWALGAIVGRQRALRAAGWL
jgi:hypothetical protein